MFLAALFLRLPFVCGTAEAMPSPPPRTLPCGGFDSNGQPVLFNTGNSGHSYACTITVVTNSDGSEDITINQPVVDLPSFEYSAISFSPGDLITIKADGCVQTAGFGSTWKRYVNPSGSDSGLPGGLYYGEIAIKGATWSQNGVPKGNLPGNPISDVVSLPGQKTVPEIFVPDMATFPGESPVDLILGYQDNDYTGYGGNGYWGHDDGNDNQCQNADRNAPYFSFGGPAFVKLHVVHKQANPFGSVVPNTWDLVPHGLDANGLFQDPEWGWQMSNIAAAKQGAFDPSCLPGCSSQDVTYDSATITATNWFDHMFLNVCNLGIPPFKYFGFGPPTSIGTGHHNWFDVTYAGTVVWVEHSGGVTGDDDYNMRILTPAFHRDPTGTTAGNADSQAEVDIGIEFDSDETIDHFTQDDWWNRFHHDVDNHDTTDNAPGTPPSLLQGDAVVIGVMGFDEMHPPDYTELHPVHGLALRQANGAPDASHDKWSFFARNWGDEGECSHLQHYLMSGQITFQVFPPKVPNGKGGFLKFGTASLVKDSAQVFGQGSDGKVHFFSGPQGTFVTLNLSPAVNQPFAYGEFELAWNKVADTGGGGEFIPGIREGSKDHKAARSDDDAHPEPEKLISRIWSKMNRQQHEDYNTVYASLYTKPAPAAASALEIVVEGRPPQRPSTRPVHQTAPATERIARDTARLHSLCAAAGGRLPGYEELCGLSKTPPVTVASVSGSTVTLKVFDASGSGIDRTEYSLDGGKTWVAYSKPFVLVDGAYEITARATDKAGTREELRRRGVTVKTK
jgi:hypothetical protein